MSISQDVFLVYFVNFFHWDSSELLAYASLNLELWKLSWIIAKKDWTAVSHP